MAYDSIILGLGAMGSAAAFQLADRGQRVLGLDQFDIPHNRGSSHGHSRMIRLCYYEHPDYVPLLRRAYELWRDLERQSGQRLLHITGGVYAGRPDAGPDGLLPGSLRAARQHALDHEELSRDALAARFPQFTIPDDYAALYEPAAGWLSPERVISAQAQQALRAGAELHGHEPILHWRSDGSGVVVQTPRAEHRARTLIISAGAWAARAIGDLGVTLTVTRQVMGWVWPRRPELFEPPRMPVWAIEQPDGRGLHYGFPMMPDSPGVKLALHRPGPPIDPGATGAAGIEVTPDDASVIRAGVRAHLPDADGPLLALRPCMYTMSPDSHFILDRHPSHPNVILACGFSGHGFKFASVIGEILADLATNNATRHRIGFLSLSRFGFSRT